MNQRHRDSYARLLGEWAAYARLQALNDFKGPGLWTDIVLEEIARFEQDRGVRIRPDGQLLLAINFDLLIGQPLALAGNRGEKVDIQGTIREDVRTLLNDAANLQAETRPRLDDDRPRGDGDQEISAHLIVDALSRGWGRLRSAAQNLWD